MNVLPVIQEMLTETGASFKDSFDEASGRYSFATFIAMPNSHIRAFIDVVEGTQEIFFYAYSPVLIPAGVREPVGDFLLEENAKIKFGRYHLDAESGEIHFTSGFRYDDSYCPSNYMLFRNFHFALGAMDLMIPEIMLKAVPKPPPSAKDLIPFWYN